MRACALAAAASLLAAPSAAAQGDPPQETLARIAEIGPALRACWRLPPALRAFERLEATVRLSLRSDGALLGEPRLSFVGSPVPGRARDLLGRSVLEAVVACTPLPLSAGLGRAIAGRVFAVRFIYEGPRSLTV